MVKQWVEACCKQDICSLKIYPNRLLLQREKVTKKKMILIGRSR